ncbi:chromosome partitioning protein ParA [Vibrio mediterranei]
MHRILFTMVIPFILFGCNTSNGDHPPSTANTPMTATLQPKSSKDESSVDNLIHPIEKTPELVQALKAQPTIDGQLRLLYDRYEPMLDRSDSLTGPDENQDGIRDDIEAFINALEVTDPVRNVIKQSARDRQKNLYYDDWSNNSDDNITKAWRMGDEYEKILACYQFVGVDIDDIINTEDTLTALTYNTKARTMNYIAYNHLQDGSYSVSLPAEAQYCE